MQRLTLSAILVTTLGLLACGNSNLIQGFNPGPAPDATKGFQIILPPVKDLQPGADYEYCTWTDKIFSQQTDIKSLQGIQSVGGHHVVIFATSATQPAGTTRICRDSDMASFRFLVGAGGEGQAGLNSAPGDVVFRLPAGMQVVVNHHYINASVQTIEAQSAVNVFYADPTATNIPAGALTVLNTNLDVPPGASSLDINCTMQQDYAAWMVIPHMHAYGTQISIEHTHAGVTDQLFSLPWNPSYTFHPPQVNADPASPYMFKAGDGVHVHCEWQNTTTNVLTFGVEMCVMFSATVDTQNLGNWACDTASGSPQWTTF